MADTDLLPSRGVTFEALVDSTGIAINGSSTVAQLAAKGMRAACAVDGTGTAITGGASLAQLAAAGIRAFCAIDQNGVAQDASTADQLRSRGIRPRVLLDATGVALNGSAGQALLASRGLQSFCPVDESGNATTMGAVILISNTNVFDNIAVGATVGTLSVAGGSGTYTFTLPSNPGAHFATAGTNGVNLNTATALTAGSYPVTVQAAGGVPTPISRALSITVNQSPVIPANTALPVISGPISVGSTLTTTDGTWTGFPAPSFTYQWKRGGTAISGATANSYPLALADTGTMITVTVTATNAAGNVSATSAAVGPIISAGGGTYTLAALPGTFPFTGSDMTIAVDYTLVAQVGAFAFNGFSATLTYTAGAYTGPGDVTGWNAAYGYWGLRAYNAAKIGTNCIDVCSNVSGAPVNLTTIVTGPNGYANLSGVVFSPIYINKLYDQAGTQHVTAASARPQLITNALGGQPIMSFDGSSDWFISAAVSTALAQPLTAAAISGSTLGQYGFVISDGNYGYLPIYTDNSNQVAQSFGGTAQHYPATDGVVYSLISVANGNTLSTMSVNGTITTVTNNSVGTNGMGATNKLTIGAPNDGGATPLGGRVFEVLIKAGAVSPANQALLTSNQHAIGTGW